MNGAHGDKPSVLQCTRVFVLALFVLFAAGSGFEDDTRSGVRRNFRNRPRCVGGAVSGATITVKSLETGAVRTVTTDATGNFRVLALPLGPQEVKAEKTGIQSCSADRNRSGSRARSSVNLQLELGEVVQQVIVSGTAPVVNTTTSSVSGIVGEREVKDLPLNGRSFDNLITLNPGAINYAL